MTDPLMSVVMHRGSLRIAYHRLPRSVWPELNRLKREECFSDLPHDPTPGDLVLRRYLEDPVTKAIEFEAVVVVESGRVLRFTETRPPLVPVLRMAA